MNELLHDGALEANRQKAWRCFWWQRRQAEQAALWAAELAEWLRTLGGDLPHAASEVADLAQAAVKARDLEAVRRYVKATS